MKRFSEQFHKKAQNIRLSAAERSELHERLVSYMEYHPLPQQLRTTAKTPLATKLTSEPFAIFNIDFSVVRAFTGVFAVILVVVVPVLAERAVPGDVLYPVKIQFNEELRSTLTLSPYAQVEWETERLERRLAEARLLANEGKLTDEVEAEVATAVKEHSDKAKQSIAKIRETDADEAALAEITFASALAVQSEVLEGHLAKGAAGTKGDSNPSVVALADVVAKEQQSAEAAQATVAPSYERLLARVEEETTNTFELFESVKDSASEEEVANIERRLSDIERKVLQAIALHDTLARATSSSEEGSEEVIAGREAVSTSDEEPVFDEAATGTEEVVAEPVVSEADQPTAVALLRAALTDIRKLTSFMTDIDVRANVAIDDLVPVVLTDDERHNALRDALAALRENRVGLTDRDVEQARLEKFAAGVRNLDVILGEAEAAFTDSKLEAAETAVREAQAMVRDLYANSTPVPVVERGTSTDPVVIPDTATSTEPATNQGD